MRKLLFYLFLLTAAVPAKAAGYQTDTLWKADPYATDVRANLAGREPGVVVTSSLGAPGMTPSVFIQGYHLGNQQPVYIVDGMRVLHLDTLAPGSVEDVTVLTGAKALALFGPAGANGALIITTKSAGKRGFHASYGFTGALQQLAWEPGQITRQEWARYYPHFGSDQYKQSENNVDQIQTSFVQTHHLNLQYSDSRKFKAAATFDFLDNDGPFKGRNDAQRRFSGSARVEYKPLYWLRTELSATMGKSDVSRTNALHRILLNYPVKVDNGYDPYIGGGGRLFKDFTGNALAEVRTNIGLLFRAHAGYSAQRAEDHYIELSNVSALHGTQNIQDWKYFQYDLETQYHHRFGDHILQAILMLRGNSVIPDEAIITASAVMDNIISPGKEDYNYISLLDPQTPKNYWEWSFKSEKPYTWGDGHLNLTYEYSGLLTLDLNYYLLHTGAEGQNLTYRVPSAQLSWNAGKTLRNMLPSWWTGWSWDAAWSSTNEYSSHSLPVRAMSNSLMTKSSRLEVGTDLRFRSLSFKLSWFSGQDHYDYTYPVDLNNQGWTFAADWAGRSGDFLFVAGLNAALYHNKCTTPAGIMMGYSTPDYSGPCQYICSGYPLGAKFLNAYAGLDSEGHPVYKTPGGAAARDVFGNVPFPTVTLGVHFDMQWHRWSLNFDAHGNFGQSIMRSASPDGIVDEAHDLLTRHYMAESWSNYNMKGKYPQISSLLQGDPFFTSSAMLHDASFFRIDQIRLQYRLPVRRLHAHVRLFASLENFFLLTSYPGSDPEYNLSWENPGYDLGAYPSTRRIVFGVNIDL